MKNVNIFLNKTTNLEYTNIVTIKPVDFILFIDWIQYLFLSLSQYS